MRKTKVVIIGAGPAGIAASIQLKRCCIEFILLEKDSAGGLLVNANRVENYPGFPEGISGAELAGLMRKQLEENKIKIEQEEVTDVDYDGSSFHILTDKGEIFSKLLVIATGTMPAEYFISERLVNVDKNVFYDIKSLLKVKNKRIAVVGAGDSAFDYAVNLAQKNVVTVLNRSNKIKCNPSLWSKAAGNANITYLPDTEIISIDTHNEGLIVDHINNNNFKIKELFVDYLIAAIGRKPNLSFINESFKEKMESLQNQNLLFMIGDVKNNIFRQTAISAGDGVKAAMQIHNKFNPLRYFTV